MSNINQWGFEELPNSKIIISEGKNEALEIANKLNQGPGVVVIDVHTHPSGLTEDYRFLSSGDLSSYLQYNAIVSNKGGTFFAGLIGVDRVNGNMSFSIVWYNKLNNKFYRVKDIMLRKKDEYGRITDIPFPKYGDTQLIYKNWGNVDLELPSSVEEDITNLKNR